MLVILAWQFLPLLAMLAINSCHYWQCWQLIPAIIGNVGNSCHYWQ